MSRSALRRVYHDLVRRRTSVRVVYTGDEVLGTPPIFLIGAYRSGTTLLRLIVDSHSQIACPPETTHLGLLRSLVDDPASAAGFEGLGFDREHLVARLRAFAAYFHEAYAGSVDKPFWADKSPEYVWHQEWLLELFPTARFVQLTRFAFDQVESHVRSGHAIDERLRGRRTSDAEDSRVVATRYWADAVEAQLQFLEAHPERCHHVRYEDLARDPESALPQLFEFLGLEWEPGVLRFHEHDHDFGYADDRARTSDSISWSTGSYRSWSAEVYAACDAIARPTLMKIGWSENPS